MPAFLFEIGLEEIPASMIAAAQAELATRFCDLVRREHLATDEFEVKSFSTPRRLAILAKGLLPKQADREEQVTGPSVAVAYKNGAATPAAIAFAKKSGVEVSALEKIQNAKGEYVSAMVRRPGRGAAEVLTSLLPAEIAGIYWPKSMYWRAGKPERFVRPVRWLLALLDEEILPLEFAGVTADDVSYGHRVLHGPEPVIISAPEKYAAALKSAYVEVEPEARRHRIRKALDTAAREIPGARWREDETLVDAVTNLTEWPSVILGSFDASYLDLPEEVLVTVMRDHQKYFALEDANGKLLPNFLAVLNIEVDGAGGAIIRHGNERVLRARFNDARFFWDVDQKIPLVDRVEMLKNVTFHKDLGSYWDKTQRNAELAARITELLPQEDEFIHQIFNDRDVDECASILAKADLTTEMVKEFPELQGIVGGLYLKAQGIRGKEREFTHEVADAIHGQYKPTSASDSIPRTRNACAVAMADKLSTVVDMLSIGLQPTGSKDPFALRRSANGIIRIVVENHEIGSRFHLWRLCQAAFRYRQAENDESLQAQIYDFLLDRLEHYLRDSYQVSLQVARAVRNSGAAGIGASTSLIGYRHIAVFAKTLEAQVGSSNVIAVAELLKRTSNILRQARERKIAHSSRESSDLLKEPAEIELARQVTEANDRIQKSYRQGQYEDVIAAIAGLQLPLNGFFDSVMVMVDDAEIRENRLALLARTESTVRWAADFSELASLSG